MGPMVGFRDVVGALLPNGCDMFETETRQGEEVLKNDDVRNS